MENVLKNVRKNAIKGIILMTIFAIIPNIGFFVYLTDPEDNSLAWIFLIFAALLDWVIIKYLIIVINPTKDNVFKKYGSPKKVQAIIDDLNKNKIFEDKNIMMSKKYITDKKDFSDLVSFNDVLGIHKLHHKRNNVTDYYGVILTDKYGFEHSYTYAVKNEKKCDELFLLIASLCPNAEVGYTKQQKQHIKENKEKLPDNYEDENDEEVFACSNCGAICNIKDKFCSNCNEKFEDDDSNEEFTCDNCGAVVKEEDTECPNCGLSFEEETADSKTNSEEETNMDKKYKDLTKLKKLLDKDIISKEEFEKEKKKILNKYVD